MRGRGADATSAEMAAPVMIALGVARRLAQVRTTPFMVSRMVGGRHLGGARGSEWRRTRVRVARERLSGRHARATALTRDRARTVVRARSRLWRTFRWVDGASEQAPPQSSVGGEQIRVSWISGRSCN